MEEEEYYDTQTHKEHQRLLPSVIAHVDVDDKREGGGTSNNSVLSVATPQGKPRVRFDGRKSSPEPAIVSRLLEKPRTSPNPGRSNLRSLFQTSSARNASSSEDVPQEPEHHQNAAAAAVPRALDFLNPDTDSSRSDESRLSRSETSRASHQARRKVLSSGTDTKIETEATQNSRRVSRDVSRDVSGNPLGTIRSPDLVSSLYGPSEPSEGGIYQHLQEHPSLGGVEITSPSRGVPLELSMATSPGVPGPSAPATPAPSRSATPVNSMSVTAQRKKWYQQERETRSMEYISNLVSGAVSRVTGVRSAPPLTTPESAKPTSVNPTEQGNSTALIGSAAAEETQSTTPTPDLLTCQKYIVKISVALIGCGAPSHRLEEYLETTAKFLNIHAQFLYLPDCMIISFDDIITHTSEVKILRSVQTVNMWKMKQIHDIYKEVLHKCIDINDALDRTGEVTKANNLYPRWATVTTYGLASAAISSLFRSRLVDMPIVAFLGMLLGFLQLVVAPNSKTFYTIFEVGGSILTTFLARAFASIQGGRLFCFSALAQGSIALILPGYTMLTAALELQSRAIVPGSIRLVYFVLYLMFLSYGVTVGTALYGALDPGAVTDMMCHNPPDAHWDYIFVALFICLISATFQAKWTQMPAMLVFGIVGFGVNNFVKYKFANSPTIASSCAAFIVGILSNLYSRISHGIAVTAVLPVIYIIVPSGLASSGAITNGLMVAAAFGDQNSTMPNPNDTLHNNTFIFDVTASMLQVGIGLTVGLFLSSWAVYPMGKKLSSLWTL
ncbi:hypothetical protein GGS21DRAFT_494570 [Xylaria nigripes]|nr:hypothetical protein GGS21DRAFT_494570 [Xylaria nigripes]